MKQWMKVLGLAVVGSMCVYGCGKSSGGSGKVELDKPVAQIQQEAQKMNVDDLKSQAEVYKKALLSKKAEMETTTQKLKDMPITKMLSQDATKLKDQLAAATTSMSKMTERLNVYVDELKKQKVDTSTLEVK